MVCKSLVILHPARKTRIKPRPVTLGADTLAPAQRGGNLLDKDMVDAVTPTLLDKDMADAVTPTLLDKDMADAVTPTLLDKDMADAVTPTLLDKDMADAVTPKLPCSLRHSIGGQVVHAATSDVGDPWFKSQLSPLSDWTIGVPVSEACAMRSLLGLLGPVTA